MKTLRDLVRQTWCRIVYGHIMVNLGDDYRTGNTLYACARCERTESLRTMLL